MTRPDVPQSLVVFSTRSTVMPDVPPVALRRLAQMSWSFNARMGITGSFRVADGCFEQMIEGPAEVILALAARILADRRHSAIIIERFHAIATRQFADWRAEGFAIDETSALLPAPEPERKRTRTPPTQGRLGHG